MKYALATMVAIFALAFSMTAQTRSLSTDMREISNFTASINKVDLVINWTSNTEVASNYWEVQGSADGKTFSTIGMVLGNDPSQSNAYVFKQKVQKIKPGLVYFRVMHIEKDASTAVSIVQGVK